MNVIVSNRQKEIIDSANIDAIKDLNGLFNVDDLISKFKNYFFSKMILDATSVVNFTMPEVLEKLASGIGSERLIILLPPRPEPPKEFTDKLKSLNITQYSTNIEEIVKFISDSNNVNANGFTEQSENSSGENPKLSYSDALNNLNIESDNAQVNSDESINEDIITSSDATDNYNAVDMNERNYNDDLSVPDNQIEQNISNFSENNFQDNSFNINTSGNVNNSINDNITNYQQSNSFINFNLLNQNINNGKKVIGLKNVTLHAGSTTLSYLLMKVVREMLHKECIGIEVNRNDYRFFQDNNLISVSDNDLERTIQNSNAQIFFVDLNDSMNESLCNEILYLVEPSIIKLNKLIVENRNIFKELANKKVVLNKSLLTNNDIMTFSREAGINIFMSIPFVNDRVSNDVLAKFITILQLNN